MSREFREYLDRQPLERKREILRAEKEYVAANQAELALGGGGMALAQDFAESMLGHEDPPAGPRARGRPDDPFEGLDIRPDL